MHEFSFMSGDFFAALILLDFLYLVLTDEGAEQNMANMAVTP